MIGSGALGCELIKGFALMGVGCGPDGHVLVTDNDEIALSNLNRQFLFRLPDVGSPKSNVACAAAKVVNPDIKLDPRQDMIYPATEHIYNDKFWNERTFVVNAVDNQKARLYVDSRC
jgi:ubiquitin-activating enzyme E1